MNVPADPGDGTPVESNADIQLEYAMECGLLQIQVSGDIPADGIAARLVSFIQVRTAETATGRLAVCVDLRGASFDVSANELRVAAFQLRSGTARGRIAMVVSSDFQFGLARMFGILCDGSGITVHPFRDMERALAWLRATGDDMTP